MRDGQPLEDRLIASLLARHGADGGSVLTGPGDDAAVVRCPSGEDLAITTDTLNEGVHFPPRAPAGSIGHRALAASLSDLASMGAQPLWAVVALSLPVAEEGWLKDFADGLFTLADDCGVRIVGGDLVRGPLSVTATLHGSAQPGAALRRCGAAAGDGVWVSGFLGDAAAGLKALQQRLSSGAFGPLRSQRTALRAENHLVERFCYPRPRVELGRELANLASACMDLSDGLSQDLPRLLRNSGLGARIDAQRLPLSAELLAHAGPQQARQLAWSGGDDYELCFTAPPESEERIASMAAVAPLARIGELHGGSGLEIRLDGHSWKPANTGFRHF